MVGEVQILTARVHACLYLTTDQTEAATKLYARSSAEREFLGERRPESLQLYIHVPRKLAVHQIKKKKSRPAFSSALHDQEKKNLCILFGLDHNISPSITHGFHFDHP